MPNRHTALITGASSGIGLELAHLFAADRCNLALVARNGDKLMELAETLREKQRISVHVIPIDLSKAISPQKVFDRLTQEGVAVDYLVNNAGFGAHGAFAELPVKRQMDMVQVNVCALTHLSRLFLPGMIERKRGGILNVASTAAFVPGPNMATYFASKAFVLSLSEALSEEVAGTGVKVSCLAPGPTHTGFADQAGVSESKMFKVAAMDAKEVARTGYNGFRLGQALIIPGLSNELGTVLTRLTPRSVVRSLSKYIQPFDN